MKSNKMPFRPSRPLKRSALLFVVIQLIVAGTGGCNNSKNSSQALDNQFKNNPEYKKTAVAQFAGKVTVDGQPPAKDCKLFVILNDVQHLDANAHLAMPKLFAACDAEGNFAFATYDRADGVATGKYVVTFVELHSPDVAGSNVRSGAAFRTKRLGGGSKKYKPPDELQNRFNDPDVNVKDDRFNLNLESPGKADYAFDLSIAGKDAAPVGPNAVTTITLPR
jgi:hypothetical protein